MPPVSAAASICTPEAESFVRFCYQRRRVGWPELYDEMCAVATRGLYQGMGNEALADIGVGFSLFETPRLAQLVARIVAEEQAARRAAKASVTATAMSGSPATASAAA
ncbi:MAG TPA: hypothetical protein VKB30_09595 [Candidatus Limnocylindrales bacterium]|nr:hypothetical protein [Candidatus Limnocylindrales bacterium]